MTAWAAHSPAAAPAACMRWNPGRVQSWRRAEDGGFNPASYGVEAISKPAASDFVSRLHYSGTYVAARQQYGLFDLAGPEPVLAGVAALSVPPSLAVLTGVFPRLEPLTESLDLGRFVLVDAVPTNGESWFLAEVRRLAAATGLRGLVSFSDPVRRTTLDGRVVMPGHWGVIYQASNMRYTGLSTPRTDWLLPDGTVFSPRAMQKIRRQERGHAYAEAQLVALGARPRRAGEPPAAWMAAAAADIGVRYIRHPGKHRYACPLGTNRRDRAAVVIDPRPRPYPKADLGQLAMFGTGVPDPGQAAGPQLTL